MRIFSLVKQNFNHFQQAGKKLHMASLNKTTCWVLGIFTLGFLLSGCSTVKNTVPAKDLCSGTKRPYEIKGIRYVPQDHYDYDESGVASWYGPGFHNKPGSCGSLYDMHSYTAAHKTLPIPSVVEVTNIHNGKTLQLVINDRGPFVDDRIIDLSKKAAIDLGTHGKGLGQVRVKALPEQSVALANYLKQYGRYGRDPSGRSWDQIYREEIADNYHNYLNHNEPKTTNAVYQPDADNEVKATLAVLTVPKIEEVKSRTTSLTYTKQTNDEFNALLKEAAADYPQPTREKAKTPTIQPAFRGGNTANYPQPIATKASMVQPVSRGEHYVQVGSFIQKHNAVKTKEELRRHGRTALALTQPIRGQQFFTIKLGPYPSKKQAQKVMETIANNGYHGITLTAK